MVLLRHADKEITGVLFGCPSLGVRKLDVADPVRAVDVIGAPRVTRDVNIRSTQKFQHMRRIGCGRWSIDVAEGSWQSLKFYL
jgi:hypothetical protein